MIIFGDFKLHHPMWGSDHTSRYSNEFVEWITDSNLVLNTTVPTYRSSAGASLIDLTVFSSSMSGYCNSYVLDCSFLNNTFITHPQLQADMFADYFASKNAYHEPLPLDFLYDKNNLLNKPFHILELYSAIKNSKNTTPGADHVAAIFFKKLDQGQRDVILRYFQKLFDNAIVPESWKHAIILPIPKPCKDKTKISSYRPIALTSVFSKTFERILANSISYYLTKERKLHPQHYGFVPFKDSRSATYLLPDASKNHQITSIAGISKESSFAYRINHYNSIFSAETLAICQVLDDLVESNVNLLVLSDSLSVLSALQNFSIKSHKVIHRLANKIYMLSNYVNQLILLWTPGHSKIVWDEQADNLARSVTESNVYIDWIASEDIHRNIYRNRIKKINETFYSSKYFEKLGNIPTIDIISKWTENRREEILSTRIFSKMIITPGLLHRFNLQDNAMCIICKCMNDLDHIILNCIRYTRHRNNLWSILRIDPHSTITFRDVLERAINNKSTFRIFLKGM
ncbi:RNase H domain-containing protein [Trichonephila clavipes]|nr:RNase H domain-containing protein [Trichonephila clavipes]